MLKFSRKQLCVFICTIIVCYHTHAQVITKPIIVDINNNKIIDNISADAQQISILLDKVSYYISFEQLGFEYLTALNFKNKVLSITGRNDGTGGHTWVYKFRANAKHEMELIGYERYYKWVSGNVSKSYNVVTGKYFVTINKYDPFKEEMASTQYFGKSTVKGIYLLDITEKDLIALDNIGSYYEKIDF